jgi:hypothetical protein
MIGACPCLLWVLQTRGSDSRNTVAVQHICRVGQNRINAPYMTVLLVISLRKIPYIHCVYIYGFGQPYTSVSLQNQAAATLQGRLET